MIRTRKATALMSVVVALLMVISVFATMPQIKAADVVQQGTWGTCPWTLDSDGVLSIGAGTGVDTPESRLDEDRHESPWYDYKNDIITVNITGAVVLPSDSSALFREFENLTTINGMSNLNTSNVTDMGYMFFDSSLIQSLDVSGFDMSNVTDIYGMFHDLDRLTSLDVSSWNTSNVTNMGCVFTGCRSLQSLNVSNWNVSNVTDFDGLFSTTTSLTSLNVSSWDTSNVTSFEGMFYDAGIQTLDLSDWCTDNVTNLKNMFSLSDIQTLDLSGWNTENVTDMERVFGQCEFLRTLDVSSFTSPNVTNMIAMFLGCFQLTELNIPGLDMSNSPVVDAFLLRSNNINTLTVGENFAFTVFDPVEGTSDVMLPNPPAETTTGKWINEDTGVSYLASELPNNVAATYVWELLGDPVVADNTLEVPVTKVVDGDTPDAPETFTFNIVPNEQTPNAPTPENGTCTVSGAGETAFGEITFTEVGRYYYDITETAGTNNEYTYDNSVFKICVEVINADNDGLKASIVATWKDDEAEKPGDVTFTNTYSATPGSLTLSKTVTGELGDHNMDFTFSVEFDDETYNFDGGEYGSITNGVGTITLKHNESITFTDVPANTTYTITETNGESYTTTINNNRSTVDGKVATGTVRRLATVNVSYTNDLPYIPVVGLNMNVIPFIALGILGVGCPGILFLRKRKYQ